IELATLSQADRTRREIERLRRDARSHPGDPGLQLALASLLLADGRIEEASAEFRELLARNPDLAVWERAGATLAGAEQYALARQFLEKAAASRPSALPDLALALFFTDGPQSALSVLDRVPPADRSGDYFLLRARMLDAAGEQAEAGKMLTEGLRQISVRPEAAWQAALLLLSQHRDADALAMLDRSLHVHPDDAGLRFAKAAVQGLLDQPAEARKSLREIEARWPEWDRPYLADGLLLSRAGNPAEARRQLQTAAILGGTDPAARCALANLSGMPEPDPRCACLTDLRRLLTPCR
ncbi:MAG TPA: tetratricopeptide repeat protein, partial [Bryobacteraceae bacterium]|nr:tetratricopeptide repeat protein [Bryobacteraceae bacterium]